MPDIVCIKKHHVWLYSTELCTVSVQIEGGAVVTGVHRAGTKLTRIPFCLVNTFLYSKTIKIIDLALGAHQSMA